MSEKVVYEIRFIETEDGLRIEMKGDKERLQELFFQRRMHRRHERHDWHAWKRWERRFHRPWPFDFGSWWDDMTEPPEKPESASSAGTV